jgi:DDE_Tnp_1-associated
LNRCRRGRQANRTSDSFDCDKDACPARRLARPTERKRRPHRFHTLLMIALCTVLCCGHGAVDMALFAGAKEPFLREFLDMRNGPPSHDTFSRLFRRLDPDRFRMAFQRFMTAFSATCQGVIAIDGKVLRRSFDRASGKSALRMVSAWGCEQRVVLAQIATDEKSNEITRCAEITANVVAEGRDHDCRCAQECRLCSRFLPCVFAQLGLLALARRLKRLVAEDLSA